MNRNLGLRRFNEDARCHTMKEIHNPKYDDDDGNGELALDLAKKYIKNEQNISKLKDDLEEFIYSNEELDNIISDYKYDVADFAKKKLGKKGKYVDWNNITELVWESIGLKCFLEVNGQAIRI